MRKNIAVLVLLGAVLFLAGFGRTKNIPESTQIFQVTEAAIGPNVRLLPITSKKYHFAEKEKEIRARLEAEINGGQRNVIAVKTSYSSGYLTSGEITYDASGAGGGNNLRILFVHSDKYYWDDKMKEVQPRLNEMVNSGKYDVVKIQTVYTSGRLLAAEIYYHSK